MMGPMMTEVEDRFVEVLQAPNKKELVMEAIVRLEASRGIPRGENLA